MKHTTDLWFASYLMLKGHKIVNFQSVGNKRGSYFFDIQEEAWKSLKLEFIKSDISKIKQSQEELKDLLF